MDVGQAWTATIDNVSTDRQHLQDGMLLTTHTAVNVRGLYSGSSSVVRVENHPTNIIRTISSIEEVEHAVKSKLSL